MGIVAFVVALGHDSWGSSFGAYRCLFLHVLPLVFQKSVQSFLGLSVFPEGNILAGLEASHRLGLAAYANRTKEFARQGVGDVHDFQWIGRKVTYVNPLFSYKGMEFHQEMTVQWVRRIKGELEVFVEDEWIDSSLVTLSVPSTDKSEDRG